MVELVSTEKYRNKEVYWMTNGQNGTRLKTNGYLSRVITYIPGDIVAAYVAAAGALEQARDTVPIELMLWLVAATLLVLTPLWILITARPDNGQPALFQAIAGTVAFACWVFALGGPFAYQPWYQPVYGTLALTFTTLVIPLAETAVVKALKPLNGQLRP